MLTAPGASLLLLGPTSGTQRCSILALSQGPLAWTSPLSF